MFATQDSKTKLVSLILESQSEVDTMGMFFNNLRIAQTLGLRTSDGVWLYGKLFHAFCTGRAYTIAGDSPSSRLNKLIY